MSLDESELLHGEPYESCFFCSRRFLFLSRFFLFDLLELLSFDGLFLFGVESDDDGSGSGSPGICAFPFCSGKPVGSVSVVGSGHFVPTGIELIGDVVPLVVLIAKGVDSKGG